ncbi:FMN-binding split barrel [Kalmanozyma brasiliensis GHG001]|nr:FMN-binding split barrel [Kalmanozyma brasiliensis GHG001]EST04966.2 FMN-binding split barrel [Kalmanozyma brasiliensis GHG001]
MIFLRPVSLWHCWDAVIVVLVLCSLVTHAWETKDQALSQAVKLVSGSENFGVSALSTTYPFDHPIADLAGHVITGPEYFAPCAATGSLLYLGLTISQTWRNVLNSKTKNATASIVSDIDPAVPDPRHTSKHHPDQWQGHRPSWRRGMPSKARVTLFGHFDVLNGTQYPHLADKALRCYLDHHPDASHWAPNATESPHIPFWATFNVDKVYWVGGFGDEHYIGWFTGEEWNAVWKDQHVRAQNPFAHKEGAASSAGSTSQVEESLEEEDRPLLAFQ